MIRVLISLSAIIMLTGCASIPFEKTELTPIRDTSPLEVIKKAKTDTPEQFTLLNSTVFKMFGHSIVALGYTAINIPDNSMSVAAMNPMGVKVFEFTDKDGELVSSYMIKAMSEKGDAASAIASDIRCMYFDRVPSSDADCKMTGKTFVFTDHRGNDTVQYVFGGAYSALIEKVYYSDNDKLWTVSYHEYQLNEGKLFPAGIVFSNHKYRYRLLVSLKEICSADKIK